MAELVDLPAGRQARYDGNMFFVYVLRSKTKNYLYVGLTNNINRRVHQHNAGKERTTKPYRPFDIIHLEYFKIRQDARNSEKQLKSGSGKEWLKSTYSN